MAKKRKVSDPEVDTSSFPSLDKKQDRELRSVMGEALKANLPEESWPIPTPIDVHFLSTPDGRREARFVFSTPHRPLHSNAMRFTCPMDMETVRDTANRGQEAIWEWLRNHAVAICTEAVARNLDMPDRISVQIASAVRFHDVDSDREFMDRVHAEAQRMAMQAVMGREVSE